MQHQVLLHKGEGYVESLTNIAKRDKESRDRLCEQKRVSAEHRELIEKMVELREVRKASDELRKLMRELKKKTKENNNGTK